MTFSDKKNKVDEKLNGDAYLLKDSKNLQEIPESVSIVLHENGFDLYTYATDCEELKQETIAYKETLIRCSLNEMAGTDKPYFIQLEAGLRTIFICFSNREERDDCFTKILASVGQFLVLNPRSRKSILGKRTSNPTSPVSPLSLSTGPTKQAQLSLLLNALDITSSPCLGTTTSSRQTTSFSLRFPALLVSLCNSKPRKSHAKVINNTKTPVARSYTLPFSKYNSIRSCKQFSARNTIFWEGNAARSSLETRAALGILNTDLGDARQYLARF